MKICWFTTGRDREAFALFHDVLSALEAGAIEGSTNSVTLMSEATRKEVRGQAIGELG